MLKSKAMTCWWCRWELLLLLLRLLNWWQHLTLMNLFFVQWDLWHEKNACTRKNTCRHDITHVSSLPFFTVVPDAQTLPPPLTLLLEGFVGLGVVLSEGPFSPTCGRRVSCGCTTTGEDTGSMALEQTAEDTTDGLFSELIEAMLTSPSSCSILIWAVASLRFVVATASMGLLELPTTEPEELLPLFLSRASVVVKVSNKSSVVPSSQKLSSKSKLLWEFRDNADGAWETPVDSTLNMVLFFTEDTYSSIFKCTEFLNPVKKSWMRTVAPSRSHLLQLCFWK